MKEATIKLLDKFFNSKVAVTIVTLLFAGQSIYTVYDYASEPTVKPQKEIIKPPCDFTKVHKGLHNN